MTERKINQKGQRRHRKSEINLALFLFQTSYLGNYQDLSDVINSDKIKSDRRWLVLNARDAEGLEDLIIKTENISPVIITLKTIFFIM